MPVEPLTQAQLDLIADHTDRGVRKALRKYARGATLAFLFLLACFIFAYQSGQNESDSSRRAIVDSGQVVAVSGCNRDFRSTQVLRGLITSAQKVQKSELKKGHISEAQYKVGKDFYDEQLQKIVLPDCLLARQVLTSDPNKPLHVPTPLRP